MQSQHEGGAFVLMGDGAVRFVTEAVNPQIFSAATSIAEGDDINGLW